MAKSPLDTIRDEMFADEDWSWTDDDALVFEIEFDDEGDDE